MSNDPKYNAGTTRNIPLHEMVADVLITGGVNGALVVGTAVSEARVGATALRNRRSLTVFNNSAESIYWGFDIATTTATGIEIPKGSCAQFAVAQECQIFLVAGSEGLDVRIAEGA